MDAARADGGLADDSGAAACIPDFPFVMPARGEKYNHPLRFYAIHQDRGGVQVRAAYDLVYLAGDSGSQPPPYPERYVRFDLVCGDPDAIPRLKGWTGRIGVYRVSTSFRPGMLARFWFVLWGSAAGETGERILLLFADVP